MGTRRYLGITKGCQIKRAVKKGNRVIINLKCGGKKINKTFTAQEIIDSLK